MYEPHHKVRLAIKPGITGMWQVSGRSDITDFEEVVRLDKEYILFAMTVAGTIYSSTDITILGVICGDTCLKAYQYQVCLRIL